MKQNTLWQQQFDTFDQLPNLQLRLYRDWLGGDESRQLFATLLQRLQWQQTEITVYGRRHPIPRLNAWYGDSHCNYQYSGATFKPQPWLQPLAELRQRLEQSLQLAQGFNSCLANLYRNGNDTVAWHSDNEPELGTEPIIAAVSLGATRRFSLKPKHDRKSPLHIDLPPGSLLVMSGATQSHWLHQIPRQKHVDCARISLTFRQIVQDAY